MEMTHPQRNNVSDIPCCQPSLFDYLERQQPLYAILDAARDRSIKEYLHNSHLPTLNLFEGRHAEMLAEFAPYLTKLPPSHSFLEALTNHAWGNSWGIYFLSQHPVEAILAHLKKQIWAHTPNGRMLFRFYDPRVLREYLPVFDASTAREFFGPVNAFFMENENGDALLRFTLGGEGAILETMTLGCAINPPHCQLEPRPSADRSRTAGTGV